MSAPVAADTRLMREINATAVLTELRQVDHTSVPALAKATGLSRQAITRSLTTLEETGLVQLLEPARTSGRSGRPAQRVRFRAEAGHILGLSVTPTEVRVALADLAGTTLATTATPLAAPHTPQITQTLTTTVHQALHEADSAPESIWHASIGAPGIVDPHTQHVQFTASMPDITGDILVTTLSELLTCDIYLDNDVKLATEGERWRGRPHHEESMVLIHWGERVGAGVVVGGQLHRGASNDAGDLGFLDLFTEEHTDHPPTNPPQLGRFEAWVGSAELHRLTRQAAHRQGEHDLHQLLGHTPDLTALAQAVHDRAPAALEGLQEITRRFAHGIGAIRALLDPQVVVVGGPMSRCGPALLQALEGHLEHQRLTPPQLELARLGEDAIVQGALHHSLSAVEATRLRIPPTRT